MRVYVTGSSALYFWRHTSLPPDRIGKPAHAPLSDCPSSAEELKRVELATFNFGKHPVGLMVPSCELRIAKRRHKYSVCCAPLPSHAFRQITEHICVAAPELCLIECARSQTLPFLLGLCMETCGLYALDPWSQRGFSARRQPLTSAHAIKRFLDGFPRIQGIRPLENAIPLIRDNARSPMEAREYLLMCLSKRLGGYGLPTPILNARIDLSPEEQHEARRRYFECDMLWPDKRVIVEYDGHEDHASKDARYRDAVKKNILMSMGYDVFTITGKQICSAETFDKTVHRIARSLGIRLRFSSKSWKQKHRALRSELFASLSAREITPLG